jgi:hypothetical protein
VRGRAEAHGDRRSKSWLLGAQVVLAALCLARLQVHDGLGFERALAFVVLLVTASAAVRVGASLLDDDRG